MLAACTEGTSWQLSRDIWAALDLSEVTKSIQGFGTSLRIGSDQATLCHTQTGGPNTYKEYSLASSPFPSTFSGSSDECSTPINLSTVFLHVQSPILTGDISRPSLSPALWLHLSFAPCLCCQHLPKHGSGQLGCPGMAELGHCLGHNAGGQHNPQFLISPYQNT